jgi:hypothetical protein
MKDGSLNASQPVVRALRRDLSEADDQKIKRVIAMVDELADPRVNQAILDSLRIRLASLNLVRPLRFSRLLFMPLDPLIVPPQEWRPGEPTVPRTALALLAKVVRAGLGSEAVFIDKTIAGQTTHATQAVMFAGEALWPRAADILTEAAAPDDWPESDLPLRVYAPLTRAISAVLRRGPQLRSLFRNGDVGVLETSEQSVNDILRGITTESEEGCAMIVQLVLLQSPHAAPLLRSLVSSGQDKSGRKMVREAIDRGTEQMLTDLESESGLAEDIGRIALANAGAQVRRIATFLQEIEHDAGSAIDRPRLYAIRQKLDHVCRERFSAGLNTGLLAPLSVASGPVDGTGHMQMETCSRELRVLESEARKVGGAAEYDRLLNQAVEAVLEAAAVGTLTSVRKLRLIEILSGPEAAAELYEQETVKGKAP